MTQWRRENDDDQAVRSVLGRLLFSGDEVKKSVQVISGGEEGRMLFGKLMLQRNNVLLMDEPTNHLDMESIESLNTALEKYTGTLIFVSHDREFVSSLATRIIEMKPDGITDFKGNYEDYLQGQEILSTSSTSRGNTPSLKQREKRRNFACPPVNPLLAPGLPITTSRINRRLSGRRDNDPNQNKGRGRSCDPVQYRNDRQYSLMG